ncbi:MAG: TerD family protein [Ruminococcus sp.]|nr:TerD family protein [Ruminococcus sp.]
MAFEIPMKKTATLDRSSLADKRGFMNIRQSLDKNTLNNDAFRKTPVSAVPARTQSSAPRTQSVAANTQPVPVRTVTAVPSRPPKKQRNLPAGNVFLKKGQKIPVADPFGIKISLGWDILDGRCEPDASAFMLGADGKVLGDEWFIFYGQTTSPDGSVKYSSGQTDDDAVMTVDFRKVSPEVQRIVFSVTIYEAVEKGLNFGMTSDVYARITDSRNVETARFILDECYSNVTAMVLGELYRYKGEWKFNAVGSGVAKDLAGFCAMYGVNLI